MKFDKDFEETILSRCLRDQMYLKRAAPLLEAYHFGTQQHAWIWKTVKGIWDEYREKPTGKLLIARARHSFPKEKDLKEHLLLVRKIAKKKPTVAKAALKELELFVRAVNAQRVLEEAAKELEKDNIDKTWEVLNRASRQDVKARDYQIVQWIEQFKQRQADRKFKRENPGHIARIPTGFKQLDTILGGGVEVQELAIVTATTGKGKSITLSNLAFRGAAAGFETVYFTFEMPAVQIAQRIDSRWSRIEYNKFKRYDFMPSELRRLNKRYKMARTKFDGKLVIIQTPVRKTGVTELVRILDDLHDDYNFTPKLVIVDSGDHMISSRRYESFRLEQADVFWGLKWLGQEYGTAVWSSSQAGKEYVGQKASAEALSESYDKGRIADIVISLNTPEKKSRATRITSDDDDEDETAEEEIHTAGRYMELFLGKNRDGEDKVTIPMDAQFPVMLIQEASKEKD